MKLLKELQINTFIRLSVVLLLLYTGSVQDAFAQQDIQYTQYMYNTNAINPAYAGSQEAISATLLYRNQWLDVEGAPKTLNFAVHSQLGGRTGGGLSFISDEIGPSIESTVAADFSYTVPVGEYSQLAFGIKGGFNLLNVDFSKLTIFDPFDEPFQQNIDNRFSPIIGAGAYLYGERFYIGISVPSLLNTTHYDDITVSSAKDRANFYFITGYVFELDRDWLFKPAFLTKAVSGAPISVDLSANFLYKQQFTLGAAYRFGTALSALAGFQINENIMLGYAYDYDTTDLGNYTSGSHELFLRFSLGDKRDDRLLEPRFF